MPNVRKRIEILERTLLPVQFLPVDELSIDHAVRLLSDEDLDTLIAAGEAEKEGVPLTAQQMGAQRAFARAVALSRFTGADQHCRRSTPRAF